MPTDPICGMFVDPDPSSLQLVRENRTYYFCSQSCQLEFAEPEHEERRLRNLLVVAWPASVAVALLTYLPAIPEGIFLAAALATLVQFYPGWVFYRGTYDALRQRTANMDVLIAVGTSAAYFYSGATLLLSSHHPVATYFDASALIIALILTGNYLEHRTRSRTGSALRRFEEIIPEQADVRRGSGWVSVPATEVTKGDLVRVSPGARFPADGVVRSGRTSVDESLLTGESLPVSKALGDVVIAGAINGEGAVEVEATGVGSDTFVAQVARLLTDAEMSRVPLKRLADRIASVFAPVVLGLALVAGVAWFLLGSVGFAIALLVFVTVAITACPCAFGIATPAAIVVGTGRAAEEGVLFRGEDSIERAARVDVVVTDKTGTLTLGAPELVEIRTRKGVPVEHVLSRAAAVEGASSHPLGRAVVAEASRRKLDVPRAESVVAEPGRGIRGKVGTTWVEIDRAEDIARQAEVDPELTAVAARLGEAGCSVSMVREDGSVVGVLGFRDPLAAEVPEALRELAQDGIRVIMATGDGASAARRVARDLGIDEFHAALAPSEKIALVNDLRSKGNRVAFVGDGINDAPALASADLGIAIGAGTAVAREAGQVILVRPDFRGVALALRLARATVRKVRGNLAWALGYNAVLLPIAMGALVPVFGLSIYQVLPIAGAIAMALSSTTVVLNSLSLRWSSVAPRRPAPVARAKPTH